VGLASEQPIHFGEGKAKLFPLGENVFMPGKSSVSIPSLELILLPTSYTFPTVNMIPLRIKRSFLKCKS
jgi:hypothetical protein